MDRTLDPKYRRRRIAKQVLVTSAILGTLVALIAFLPGLIRPSIALSRVRTAVVDVGPVEATTSASGTVVPEIERVISSPIDARVVRILKRPGDHVAPGEPIVELDVSAARLDVQKIDQNIALKRNQQEKVKLELEKTTRDIESQGAVKRLELQSLGTKVAQNRKLHGGGLLSTEALRDAELAESRARIELEQLEAAKKNAEAATRTQLEGLALEMDTLVKERDEAARQLALATMSSDREGVLTWVVNEEGATIARGAVVARVADLESFRVEATVSDVHAQRVAVGMPVRVIANEQPLTGSISAVQPTVENGALTFLVALDDRANPVLKSNMRVDVLIVTGARRDAVRVSKGPFATGEGSHEVFVLRGDRAERVTARFGISSFDAYEVLGGLAPGDEVIISDMKDYAHLREIRVKGD